MTHDHPLDTVYRIRDGLEYEVDEQRSVTVLRKQDHWIQRLARKLGLKIPPYRRTTLDEFASMVFLSIDGRRPVREIGEILAAAFGERANPLYERLTLFLSHIEQNEHYIVKAPAAPELG